MNSIHFNKTDTLPDWGYYTEKGIVHFNSKQLNLKKGVLVSDWDRCCKELNIDVNNEISINESLPSICDYFIKLGK